MNHLKYYYILVIIIIQSVSGCTKNSKTNDPVLTVFNKHINLTSNKSKINSDEIGELVDLQIFDSVLLWNEMFSPKIYKLFNIKTGKLMAQSIRKGRGPNEQSLPNLLTQYDQNTVSTYSRTKKELIFLNLKDILNGDIKFEKTVKVNSNAFQVYPINDTLLISTGIFENGQYSIFNISSQKTSAFLKYPPLKNDVNEKTKGFIFQNEISLKPDKKKFVSVYSSQSIIEICSIQDGSIKREHLTTYEIPEVILKNGSPVYPKDSKFAFHSVSSNNEHIHLIYSGRSYADHGEYRYGGNNLLVYDWNAKPILRYKLDRYLLRATIDYASMILYGYTIHPNTGNPEIVTYNLSNNENAH